MPDDTLDTHLTSVILPSAYGPTGYASHCREIPCERNDYWLHLFGTIADRLVGAFAPRSVFDAGCGSGMLVESLWDRGVEARGRDISEQAIDQVRPDMRSYCAVGSIVDPVDGEYDLVTCIEVLEHLDEAEALQAIRNMAGVAPRILFSSSPAGFQGPACCNARPPIYWLSHWAEAGFAPSITHDAGYLAPHAFILERCEEGRSRRELVGFAERVRHRVALSWLGSRLNQLDRELASTRREAAERRTWLEAELSSATGRADAAEQEASRRRDEGERRIAEAAEHLRLELARQAAEAARLAAEDRRLRAAAAQRAMEARAETADVRDALTEAQATIAEQRRQIADGNDRLVARSREHADALAAGATERARADAVEHEAIRLREAVDDARREARMIAAARDRVLMSTVWRASWPMRFVGERLLPGLLRSGVRRILSGAWWVATGKLGVHLARRRTVLRQVRAVDGSPLFDAAWYAAENPDVAASGLSPALHYVTIGGLEGRDPGPGFSARRYAGQQPGFDRARVPALVHFLQHGAGSGA